MKLFIFFLTCASLSLLASCSSCNFKSKSEIDSYPTKSSAEEYELCKKIFKEYQIKNNSEIPFEVVVIEGGTCMLSEVVGGNDKPIHRLTGTRVYTLDLESKEVRPFPVR